MCKLKQNGDFNIFLVQLKSNTQLFQSNIFKKPDFGTDIQYIQQRLHADVQLQKH